MSKNSKKSIVIFHHHFRLKQNRMKEIIKHHLKFIYIYICKFFSKDTYRGLDKRVYYTVIFYAFS